MIISVNNVKKYVEQKTGHCGPAAVVMLVSLYGHNATQEEIAEAAGVSQTIKEKGSRIDQLANAIDQLYPDLILLAKYNASVSDVRDIIDSFRMPVGVEWQGMFLDSRVGYFEEGHYSLISGVNFRDQTLTLIDPEPRSALENGTLLIKEFERRWWDDNEVSRKDQTNAVETIRNKRLLFVIVPKGVATPLRELGLAPATLSMMRESSVRESSRDPYE